MQSSYQLRINDIVHVDEFNIDREEEGKRDCCKGDKSQIKKTLPIRR
jgi:hypothetical protein